MAKTGRNEPCPCGSGKKHKRCCWETNHLPQTTARQKADEERREQRAEVDRRVEAMTPEERADFDRRVQEHLDNRRAQGMRVLGLMGLMGLR